MKLLPKSEISDLKAKEKGVEIQEGLKLAKKIDVLRETASKEEAVLAKFRTESLRLLHAEIDLLMTKKTVVEKEVEELEVHKKRLIEAIESVKIINKTKE